MLSGGIFAATAGAADEGARRVESLRSIDTAFLVIVAMLGLLTVLILACRKRMEAAAPTLLEGPQTSVFTALSSRWAVLGAVAIFLYVGAEVSIGSVLINFMHQPDVLDVSLERAGKLLSFYWGGAFIGRIIGSALLTRVQAFRLLTLFAIVAAVLCLTVSQSNGGVSAYSALAIGLFNSIMFPVIFTLTLERSTASQAATSSAALHGHRRRRAAASAGGVVGGSRRAARVVPRANGLRTQSSRRSLSPLARLRQWFASRKLRLTRTDRVRPPPPGD